MEIVDVPESETYTIADGRLCFTMPGLGPFDGSPQLQIAKGKIVHVQILHVWEQLTSFSCSLHLVPSLAAKGLIITESYLDQGILNVYLTSLIEDVSVDVGIDAFRLRIMPAVGARTLTVPKGTKPF